MIKSRRMHKMLLPVIIAVMMGCTSIQMSPDKPQAGESIKITMKEELKDPLVEVVFLKDNLDFDFDVVTPRKEKDRWVITINSDTLTSYVIWRIVDQDAIYFPGGEGVIFYKGDKPQHLAYYYCGLHKEKAIPYALDVDEKEQKKIINAAIKCYDKELKFYPGEPMAFGRKKIVEYFKLNDEREKAKYLYDLEKTTDSLFESGDLLSAVSAFNIAYFFSFSKTYDYFKYISERPYFPGALDVAMSYLYQYARNLNAKDGIKWLEVGLNKYADFIQEPSSRIKNVLRNYYYSLYYGYMVLGVTLTAIKYLGQVRQIFPMDPDPYIVEASLRMDMGALNYRVVDSLLASAEKLFNPISYSYTYPFYPPEERAKSIKRKKANLYRVEARYFTNIGDSEKAITAMANAIEAQGGDLYADFGDHETIGDFLLNAGKVEDAVKHYALAIVTGAEEENLKNDVTTKLLNKNIPKDSVNVLIKTIEETVKKNLIPAEDFEVRTLDGKRITLKDLRGKIVVLNFWATWCGPCRREIPELNNLVESYKDNNDVVFIGITNDQEERVSNFLANNPFNYTIAFDIGNTYTKYNVTAVPTHVIIDKSGYISSRIVGSLPGMDKILKEKIDKLLKSS